IGTTGISQENQNMLDELAKKNQTSIMIVPNFAIGAILMMNFAKFAAKYMKAAEIIELHHDQKVDKPSGTAIKTRRGMLESTNRINEENDPNLIPIHSVRLPGLVAHQEGI
ncbi:MAG: 4-hydroxy-tetrahydrodipicolinate reductase, partial [Candidatus Riflebacteria bacterium]|nr:4-hydroxy-tetrahydrodipicolinate reductase [Candidatus Riflebacteria bacterium]